MRILTLVATPESLPEAVLLSQEIRAFNREIDFRLRFLHIDIEDSLVAPGSVVARLDPSHGIRVHTLAARSGLEASACLALLLARERPALLVIAGGGEFAAAGVAAAAAAETKLGFFGSVRGSAEGALDLGDDARGAVERVSGVAREIR